MAPPPSTRTVEPVAKGVVTRNITAFAISSGWPTRRAGKCCATPANIAARFSSAMPDQSGVAISPGETALNPHQRQLQGQSAGESFQRGVDSSLQYRRGGWADTEETRDEGERSALRDLGRPTHAICAPEFAFHGPFGVGQVERPHGSARR